MYEFIKMLNVVVTNIQLSKKLDNSFHFSPSLPPSPAPHSSKKKYAWRMNAKQDHAEGAIRKKTSTSFSSRSSMLC